MRYTSLITAVMLVLCSSCASLSQKTLTLATFNMEWLGDNTPDDQKIRTESDLKLLAQVVRDTEADIIALQEIENDEAMKQLLVHLPEYRFALGATGGKQHVGFMVKSRISNAEFLGDVPAIAVEKNRTKAGYLLRVRENQTGTEWLFLSVHLKATSRADSTPALEERSRELRRLQAAQLRAWSDSLFQGDSLKHLVLIGDFNDSPKRKNTSLDTLQAAQNLTFLTAENVSCSYAGAPAIDHIVCSKQVLKRFRRGSLYTLNFHTMLSDQEAKRVSDHCPVVCRFEWGGE